MAGLSQAQKTLQQGLDELFKPRGQNPRINKALAEFRGAQEELKRHQLSSEEWQKHDRAYREAIDARRNRSGNRSARPAASKRGLKRIKSAIPLVARRRRLTQELDELGDVIRLRDDFGDEFRKAQDQLRLAEHTITRSRAALEEIDAQLAQLDPPRMLLDAANEIESLQERLGAVEKASAGPRAPGEFSAGLPSTRRGGSSASWVARSIWMRPRRYGSGSMSR